MKRTFSLFKRWQLRYAFVFLLLWPAVVQGAQGHIALKGQAITMKQAIELIEKNSDYTFFFKTSDIDNSLKRNIDCTGTIEEVLDEVFKNSSISYLIKEKEIILKTNNKVAVSSDQTPQRRTTITGQVISSEDNLPIIGANVWVKGTSTGSITNADGKYSITFDGVGILAFSFTGMKTQEIAITNQTVINVVLNPDTEVLDEVVVVGYGHQKKESVVGAISTIDVGKLQVPGSSNLSTLLSGQLSGVVAMNRSGEPGRDGAADFYIRGVSSFKGNTTPLVLVDGIERELDLVDTEDIKSFSILKDASASAVYGVRGANGVILIETKKGEVSKPTINVRAEAGITSPTKMPKFTNSEQWAELYNEASGTNSYSAEVIQKYRDGSDLDLFPNVNWIDELYKDNAYNHRINLNMTGGSDIVKYYVAGSYYHESSIFEDAGDRYDYNSSISYNKFNFRANLDFSLTKSTNVSLNLANIYEKSFGPGEPKDRIWEYTFNTSPNAFPMEYSDGTLASPSTSSGYNPWNLLANSGYREQFWNSSQSLIAIHQDFGAIWKPLQGLSGNFKFSWDAFNTTTQIRAKSVNQFHASGRDEDGNLIFGNPIYKGDGSLGYEKTTEGTMTTYMEASLTYNRLFDQKHRVGALFLYNHKIHNNTQEGDKYKSLPYKDQGIAGRVTYAFKDTYFAEFNMGYNGSENFARGHRFGFFPAAAIGWMVSNEKWFEPALKVVDMLKLKASHGTVGNDDIGGARRWMYQATINKSDSWNYGHTGSEGGEGIMIGDVENLYMSWEEATKTNIGFEISLLEKVKLQADYFREERNGIYLQRAGLPAIVGLTTIPYTNIGKTLNQGIDATLEYTQQVGQVLLSARGNFTYNRNKLLDNDEPDWQYKYQNRIGKPFGQNGALQPFGLVALGLFESQEEIDNSPVQTFGEYRVGDIKYQDINGDGKIDSYDQIAIGHTNLPEITYGFGFNAQWKGWDANIFFQGIDRISFFLSGTAIRPFSSNNPERSAINADIYNNVWKSTNTPEQNALAKYPRMSMNDGSGKSNNNRQSTYNMRDGSFLRLKNVEIGYSLPKSVLGKTFIKRVRIYASATNLLTFSNFKLWDPERGSSDGSGYPPNRIISLGLNANF